MTTQQPSSAPSAAGGPGPFRRSVEQASRPALELLGRLSAALESELIRVGPAGPTHLRVTGGRLLSGSVAVKSSKNAAVALLCAALLNRGRTTLRNVARIVEV